MKRICTLLACVLSLSIVSAVHADAPTPAPASAPADRTIYNDHDYSPIEGTPLSIVVPDGYLPTDTGKKEGGLKVSGSAVTPPPSGATPDAAKVEDAHAAPAEIVAFRHKKISSTLGASRLAAPYADVIKVFTAEEMAKRGMRLLSKDNVSLGGRAAILMQVSENTQDATIFRWTLVIGDYQETYLLSGTYPKDFERELSAPLRAAIMSTRWTKREKEDPFVNFNFTVEPTPKLVYSKYTDLPTLVVFTADGIFPLVGPGDPLFIAGYELNEGKITDERSFAEQALKKVPTCTGVTPGEMTTVTLGGLNGFEASADAKNESSGTPVKIYQALLFSPNGYHIFLLGIVDVPRADAYLPDFKATARTFKLRPVQ